MATEMIRYRSLLIVAGYPDGDGRVLPIAGGQTNDRNRRNGDPERAAPKVHFRHDRCHSHSVGDLPGDPFHDFPGWVRPAFSKGTYLTGFTLDNTEVSVRSRDSG